MAIARSPPFGLFGQVTSTIHDNKNEFAIITCQIQLCHHRFALPDLKAQVKCLSCAGMVEILDFA